MEIHGTKEYFYKGERSNSHRIGLKHQHGRRFTVLGQEYARRKVMRKCSISINKILIKNKYNIDSKKHR